MCWDLDLQFLLLYCFFISVFFSSFYSPFFTFFAFQFFIALSPFLFLPSFPPFFFTFVLSRFSVPVGFISSLPRFLLPFLPFCFSLPFPPSFSPLFCLVFQLLWVSSLAYPDLLETKRLGYCCCDSRSEFKHGDFET
jgi:hypothetical protein